MKIELSQALDAAVESAGMGSPTRRRVHIPHDLPAAICKGHESEVFTKEDRAESAPIIRECENLTAYRLTLTMDRGVENYVRQQENNLQRAAEGRGAEIQNENVWSLREHKDDILQQRKGVGARIHAACAKLYPMQCRVAKRIGVLSAKEAIKLRAQEEAVAARFQAPYSSPLLSMLDAIAADPMCIVPPMGSNPNQILAFAGIAIKS